MPSRECSLEVICQAIVVMSTSCDRLGELRRLRLGDLCLSLAKEDQKVGHWIRVIPEVTKTGEARTI